MSVSVIHENKDRNLASAIRFHMASIESVSVIHENKDRNMLNTCVTWPIAVVGERDPREQGSKPGTLLFYLLAESPRSVSVIQREQGGSKHVEHLHEVPGPLPSSVSVIHENKDRNLGCRKVRRRIADIVGERDPREQGSKPRWTGSAGRSLFGSVSVIHENKDRNPSVWVRKRDCSHSSR